MGSVQRPGDLVDFTWGDFDGDNLVLRQHKGGKPLVLPCTLAHDLRAMRDRGMMELAWAGCTDDEITTYSGHASKAMVIKYAGEARQIVRARQAREKRW